VTNKLKLTERLGFANLIVLVGILLVAISLPIATKLVQQNQENRSSAAENEKTIDYDFNLDNKVDQEDVSVIQNYIISLPKNLYDINNDNQVDIADAAKLIDLINKNDAKDYDFNLDNTVDQEDVSVIQNYIISLPKNLYDINNDNQVDIMDLTKLIDIINKGETVDIGSSKPHLYFSSDTNTCSTTQPCVVTIKVDSGPQKIDGVDILMEYDPSILTLLSAEKSNSFVFNNVDGDCSVIKQTGKFIATCYPNNGLDSLQVNGALMDLTFIGKKEATTNLSFTCTDGSTLDSNIVTLSNKQDIISCKANKTSTINVLKTPPPPEPVLDEKNKIIKGKNIDLTLDKEYVKVITDNNLNLWLSRLDTAYADYADLTGWKPYNGEKITIKSVECGDSCPGWAWAGQTISWARQWWQKDELKRINDNDDWSFGILHELSHDFDNYDVWGGFDNEMMANFKMAYVLEKENSKVLPGGYDTYYTGSEIINIYKKDKEWGYDAILDKYKNGEYDKLKDSVGNFLLYKFLVIKDDIGGWDTYKQVFRNLTKKGKLESANEKINAFLDEITNVSKKDVRSMFTKDEKAILELKFGDIFPEPEVFNLTDLNQDGVVNSIDFSIVKKSLIDNNTKGDINSDGKTNSIDLNLVKRDLFLIKGGD